MSYPTFGDQFADTTPTSDDDNTVTEEPNYPEPETTFTDAGDDIDDEDDEDDDAGTSNASKKAARRKSAARGTRPSPSVVRRVLARSELISAQSERVQSLLGAALGTTTAIEDLVAGTFAATKAVTDTIAVLEELPTIEDPFERMLPATAISGDRDASRRTWAMLVVLGKETGALPAKEVIAGIKIAAAAGKLDIPDLNDLNAVTEILGA